MPAETVPQVTFADRHAAAGAATTTASLSTRLAKWERREPGRAVLAELIRTIAETGIRLAAVIAIHPLRAALGPGRETVAPPPGINPDGDQQQPLDLYAERLFADALAGCDVAAVASEESAGPIPMRPGGSFVVTLDPVDGSSNIDANAPVGTVFGVLPAGGTTSVEAALLLAGRHQVAAGMIIYGPSTILVLTLGEGTDSYVLDPRTRDFRLARGGVQVPAESREYAINASNARHWGPGIREYIADLVSGAHGPRERDFNMRWLASMVGDAYRILTRGGIFLYPADSRPGYQQGRIRLLYEANPIAFLVEQAGGAATDGATPILDLQPARLHQRVPLVFGSRGKVDRVRRYLVEPGEVAHERFPLFGARGLFRS